MERLIVRMLCDAGLAAERVPLSGAAGGSFAGDIYFDAAHWNVITGVVSVRWRAEVKARREGWKTLRRWLGDNDALVLKADREAPLVVLPWERFVALCGGEASDGAEIRAPWREARDGN